jgi:hypothetical protein
MWHLPMSRGPRRFSVRLSSCRPISDGDAKEHRGIALRGTPLPARRCAEPGFSLE